jgi:pyruvate/2-oxoglutarate dehydrogenase complex dihydrolipoamide acyltransferase (E2) component
MIAHVFSCKVLTFTMPSPVVLPILGTETEIRVSSWLVDLGDHVEAGDRIVEVLMRGITFDVSASVAGILTEIVKPLDSVVRAGDTLGWIEPHSQPIDDRQPGEYNA